MSQPSTATTISHKVVRNTLFNFAGRSWTLLLALLLTPYIVSKLGIQGYGTWVLILVVTSYCSLLDVGVGTSLTKYVAEYHTKGDSDTLNSVISTGFAFFLCLAVVVIPVAYLLSNLLLQLLRIPPRLFGDAQFVLTSYVAIFALSNAFGVFQAAITGLQRMGVRNIVVMVMSVPQLLGTVVALEFGYGLRGLVVNEAVVSALTAGAFAIVAFRLLPNLQLALCLCSWARMRQLLHYGVKVQVSQLAELASSQADKILLALFLGVSAVTYYDLGAKVVSTAKRLSWVWMSAIMPAASEIDAREDHLLLHKLYMRGSKYLVLATAPVFLFLAFSAPWVMHAWMGPGYELSARVIQALAVAHFVHLLTGVGTMIVKGIGKPEYETRYTLLLSVLQGVLALLLIQALGFIGVLIATPFALILGSIYFLVLVHRLLDIPLVPFTLRVYLPPVGVCLVAGLIAWGFGQWTETLFWTHGRITSLIALGGAGFLFILLYGLISLRTGCLDDYDRGMLNRIGQALARA